MAGAHATQMVSALLRHGPDHLRTVRRDIESWMQEHEWSSLTEMRGNMSFERIPDPAAYERANFRWHCDGPRQCDGMKSRLNGQAEPRIGVAVTRFAPVPAPRRLPKR